METFLVAVRNAATYIVLLLSAKTKCSPIMIGLASNFGSQPFLVIFEFPHLKYNHGQKYTFLRTADIWAVDKVAG